MPNLSEAPAPPSQPPALLSSTPAVELRGVVEKIIFESSDTGYSVFLIDPKNGAAHAVVATGYFAEINVGDELILHGDWTTHPKFGQQLAVATWEPVLPASEAGIRAYLASGLVTGIGGILADRIVAVFGTETLKVLDEAPERLEEVPGIGPRKAEAIRAAWTAQRAVRTIMVFLSSYGVSPKLAMKIYKQYGGAAPQILSSNPYRLAHEVRGIGFKTADKIARAVGIAANALERLEAAILFALDDLCFSQGHVCPPQSKIFKVAAKLLELESVDLQPALLHLAATEAVITAETNGETRVYPPPLYRAEVEIVERLRQLMAAPVSRLAALRAAPNLVEQLAQAAERAGQREFSEEQMTAVRQAVESPIAIVTGNPGVGKTTCLKTLVALLESKSYRVALACPTGRAAKRLAAATGREAITIHRLLGFSADGTYQRVEEARPLEVDMLIVDESSMVDVLLFQKLLKVVEPGTHLVLVGDADQLPSVGPGDLLRDLIRSGAVPTTHLVHIHRQAEGSGIIVNAHRVNRGEMPVADEGRSDFFFITTEQAERAAELVIELVLRRIPQRFNFDPLRDVQVLVPMYRGEAGIDALNHKLQEALNPPGKARAEQRLDGRTFRVGDRLMVLSNDRERGVFNGDVGWLAGIDSEEQKLAVSLDDGRQVEYTWAEADGLAHAYAVSIHKSQGSEYPVTVIVLLTEHYLLLFRSSLYTGITRAKELCVLVGSKKAVAMAVRNVHGAERYTSLAARLAPLDARSAGK